MLPRSKPSEKSQREQARLPGKVRYRKPMGDDIEPRSLQKTRRIAPEPAAPSRDKKSKARP